MDRGGQREDFSHSVTGFSITDFIQSILNLRRWELDIYVTYNFYSNSIKIFGTKRISLQNVSNALHYVHICCQSSICYKIDIIFRITLKYLAWQTDYLTGCCHTPPITGENNQNCQIFHSNPVLQFVSNANNNYPRTINIKKNVGFSVLFSLMRVCSPPAWPPQLNKR